MKFADGWYCPDALSHPGKYLKYEPWCREAMAFLPDRRRRVIQAGAHIGCYPAWLAEDFEHVHCFEIAEDNYEAAARNLERFPNVTCTFGGLMERPGVAHLARKHTATHYRSPQKREGKYPTVEVPGRALDEFGYTDVDALFYDMEGGEVDALRGSLETIAASRPMLVVECTPNVERYGRTVEQHRDFISGLGYEYVARVHRDDVWRPTA